MYVGMRFVAFFFFLQPGLLWVAVGAAEDNVDAYFSTSRGGGGVSTSKVCGSDNARISWQERACETLVVLAFSLGCGECEEENIVPAAAGGCCFPLPPWTRQKASCTTLRTT